jgi:RNA polymerase sigma-70 factor (ECF subfamily)
MVEVDERRTPPPRGETGRLAWWRPQRAPEKAPFEDIWQVERSRVRSLAARLLGSPDDAEDITQEVAVRALRSWDSFRGDSDVRTWLYRITLNIVSRHRASYREHFLQTDASDMSAEVAAPPADQPEERLLQAEGLPDVRRALDALPEELRTPLVLQVYEEMKCREIAALLGLPLGTVLSRLYTARKRLLSLLSEGNSAENAL